MINTVVSLSASKPINFCTRRIASLDPTSFSEFAAEFPRGLGPDGQHATQDLRDIRPADRLGEMIEGSEPHRLDGVCRARVSGEDRDDGRLISRTNAPQELETVHARHAQVDECGIDALELQDVDGCAARLGRAGLVPEIAHRFRERFAEGGIIIDDQSARL
jgi:hypothetical protein